MTGATSARRSDIAQDLSCGAESKNVTGAIEELDPATRDAVRRITWIEELTCSWLIVRQLTRGGRRVKERERYGPKGAVEICRARAIMVYIVVVAVLGTLLRFTGLPGVIPAFLLVMSFLIAVMSRLVAAVRAGKQWRSTSQTPAAT